MSRVITFDTLVGLPNLKRMAERDIAACNTVGEVFPHTGLFGPGGLGKTTFAHCMSLKLGYFFREVEAAAVRDRETMIRILSESSSEATRNRQRLLLFIDEAHRLGVLQEVLLLPLKDFYITTTDGSGRIDFPPFTLVAATTDPNMLKSPFLTRLQNKWFMEPYPEDQMRRLVDMQLRAYGLDYDFLIVNAIAKRSLGNPRICENLCKKLRNTVLAKGRRTVKDSDCAEMFHLEGIDEFGLDRQHVRYLVELLNAQGVPKGISAVAGRMGLDEDVVRGSIEPALLQLGFIDLTNRGRVLTRKGHLHLAQTGLA